MSPQKTFMITGANTGLGLDAARQLALRDDVEKVYLTARSKAKAAKAIKSLVGIGISKNKLDFILFDGAAPKSDIEAAAAALPKGLAGPRYGRNRPQRGRSGQRY